MKQLEVKRAKSGGSVYVYTGDSLLAEFLGTAGQAAELVGKFNQHAELVKALRDMVHYAHGKGYPAAVVDAEELINRIAQEGL